MTTPEKITKLEPNEVFVFGSNLAGRHGRGAARDALRFGARHGVGVGPCGKTYGIPTKGRKLEVLSLYSIGCSVHHFLQYAVERQHMRFLVTPIGCGLAGYKPKEIAPMFNLRPSNVILPACFIKYL